MMTDAWSDEFYWLDGFVDYQAPDENHVWNRRIHGERFAADLLSRVPSVKDAGLEVTELPTRFMPCYNEDGIFITRCNTRRVYDAVCQRIVTNPTSKRVLIEGASGTGKRRSLTYLLKLLLCENRKVLLYSPGRENVYAFIPPKSMLGTKKTDDPPDRYRCYSPSFSFFDRRSKLTEDPNVVLLYNSSRESPDPPLMRCSVVVLANSRYRSLNCYVLRYQLNTPSFAEVKSFFDILRPAGTVRSSVVAAGETRPTFMTPFGPVLQEEFSLPLGEEHLAFGYHEIGGSLNGLANWRCLKNLLDRRNIFIHRIDSFDCFSMTDLKNVFLCNDERGYREELCAYHNDSDPVEYDTYHHGVQVTFVAPGTLAAICRMRYNLLYSHVESEIDSEGRTSRKAISDFHLLARTALSECPQLVIRNLQYAPANPRAHYSVKRHVSLRRLDYTERAKVTVLPTAELLATVAKELPSGEPGVSEWESLQPLTTQNAIISVNESVYATRFDPPRPLNRSFLCADDIYGQVDGFDQRNRGYKFTLHPPYELQYTLLMEFLTQIGASPENPFHFFFAVPQENFDKWTAPLSVVKSELPEITCENQAFIAASLRQYVVCIPKSL